MKNKEVYKDSFQTFWTPEQFDPSELFDSCSEPSGLLGAPVTSFNFLRFLGLPFSFGAEKDTHNSYLSYIAKTVNVCQHYLNDCITKDVPLIQDNQMFLLQTIFIFAKMFHVSS